MQHQSSTRRVAVCAIVAWFNDCWSGTGTHVTHRQRLILRDCSVYTRFLTCIVHEKRRRRREGGGGGGTPLLLPGAGPGAGEGAGGVNVLKEDRGIVLLLPPDALGCLLWRHASSFSVVLRECRCRERGMCQGCCSGVGERRMSVPLLTFAAFVPHSPRSPAKAEKTPKWGPGRGGGWTTTTLTIA